MNCQTVSHDIQLYCQSSSTQIKQNLLKQITINKLIDCDKSIELKQKTKIYKDKNKYSIDPFLQNYKQIIQKNDNKLISVPIKQYSNKFLREKKKEELQKNLIKNQHLINNRLHNNRKLISQFKKYKYRNKNNKKSSTQQNDQFIIHNLLFDKQYYKADTNKNKTIFGTFTQSYMNSHNFSQQSRLLDKKWSAPNKDQLLQTKKQFYEKICQRQKQRFIMPQYRKKCKTLADSFSIDQQSIQKQKKLQRISTSRALQKYSKIIKINPEQGKLQKMKIKRQLAKSLRLQTVEKGQIQTKKITLAKKQAKKIFHRSSLIGNKRQSNNVEIQQKQNNFAIQQQIAVNISILKTIQKNKKLLMQTHKNDKMILKQPQSNVQNVDDKIMVSIGKSKKYRKYSHQIESQKIFGSNKNKKQKQNIQMFQDFQINGWQSTY